MKSIFAAAALSLLGATSALAQSTATAGPLPVTGSVPSLCSSGAISGGNSTFGLGVMINTSTGFMLSTLSAPNKIVTGSFCNAQSTLTIAATPMLAQSSTGAPPAGFSNAVNFTASASGWTATPASMTTGAASNPAASQSRATPFSGDITVGVSGFSPVGGSGLRLVSDPAYSGTVTLTLAVAT
jgi:hypothetical protein